MPTLVYLTGFEYRAGTPPIGSGGGLGADRQTVGGTVSIQNTIQHSGEYSLAITRTGAGNCNFAPPTISSGAAIVVGRFYFRVSDLPDTGQLRVLYSGDSSFTDEATMWLSSAGVLSAKVKSGTEINGPTIVPDQWYRIDFKHDQTTTAHTFDWQVDGAAQTQATATGTARTTRRIYFCCDDNNAGSGTGTPTFYFDTVAWGVTSGDYPLGPGDSSVYRIGVTGTHSEGSGSFLNDVGGTTDGSTDHNRIDEEWSAGTGDFWEQTANDAAAYLEFGFDNTSGRTKAPNGVMCYVKLSADTTSTSACEVRTRSNTTETTIHTGTIGSTSAWYKSAMVTPGSSPWTTAQVDALLLRFGYASDADPDVHIEGGLIEVDWPPEPVTGAATIAIDLAFTAIGKCIKYGAATVAYTLSFVAAGAEVVASAFNLFTNRRRGRR